jgi:septum site-determining protein MinC
MAQAQTGRATARSTEVFELKSASLSLLSLLLRSADVAELATALQNRLGETPEVFNNDPLLIDLSHRLILLLCEVADFSPATKPLF